MQELNMSSIWLHSVTATPGVMVADSALVIVVGSSSTVKIAEVGLLLPLPVALAPPALPLQEPRDEHIVARSPKA